MMDDRRTTFPRETASIPMPDQSLEHELQQLDRYWHAANYLSVGQIYLLDNPLLTEPLRPDHIKPRLLGHWGTTPGLNFVYAHLNRIIRARDEGAGVLLVSSELDEILALADRILVMYDGRLAGEFARGQVTERELGLKMGGA